MTGPKVITGAKHKDHRGTIFFNNEFDATQVKRLYIIENADTTTIRAWQGHRIEQRWFSAIIGSFKIQLIQVDNWENPSNDLPAESFILRSDQFSVLHIPAGFVSSIQANEDSARLLVMADTLLDEMNDEYRYPSDYFKT